MACISLTALPLTCGTEGNIGGIEKAYVLAAKDLAPTTGDAGDPVYTTATNGIVSAIGLASGKTFVEVGLLKSTSGLKETGTFNDQTGSAYLTQEFTLTLGGVNTENRTFVQSVFQQPIVVLLKGRSETPKYFVAGLNGQLKLSALEGGTGTAEADLIGYKLTFTGLSTVLIPLVDNTIIPDLLTA